MKSSTVRTAMIGLGVCAILFGVLAAVLVGLPVSKIRQSGSGQIQIEVYDGVSDKPVDGATVVIPETNQSYTTDASGKTPVIEMPIVVDARFEKTLHKPWGEITVLCYKDGYISYALFNAQVWENQSRQGPRLYIFQQNAAGSNAPFSIIETPHRLWVEDMLEKYKPGSNSAVKPAMAQGAAVSAPCEGCADGCDKCPGCIDGSSETCDMCPPDCKDCKRQ